MKDANIKDVIWSELRFFQEKLSELSVSKTIALGSGLCVSVGSYSENWVYLPEPVDSEDYVSDAVMFFDTLGETFVWPLYEGSGEVLERGGVNYVGDLMAMSIDPKDMDTSHANERATCERVASLEEARIWADVAWRSFGGDDNVPEDYCRFIEAVFRESKDLSLHLARLDGEPAGTIMLTHQPDVVGAYYGGTLPNMRRKGIAAATMKEASRIAGTRRIVHQSTPMGLKFYQSVGFKELFAIPVYSTDKEILLS
ncbi:MAG: GNAT family N-acetyltransferase [Synergistaceae bacterium]|nr:GNAT family N-acetyltransferase [Synergistaceae bacterium]